MLKERYDKTKQSSHLQEAIDAYQILINCTDSADVASHTEYDTLVDLSYAKWEETEALQDVDQAIRIGRTFMSKLTLAFPDQTHWIAKRAIDLSKALHWRYLPARDIADLDHALSLCQQVIELTKRSGTLSKFSL